MRIKELRGWDEQKKEMLYSFDIDCILTCNVNKIIVGRYNDVGDWYELVLMDDIGLKDSKGNHLYEGDIVISEIRDEESIFGWIEWDIEDSRFIIRSIQFNETYYFNDDCHSVSLEILGNIYQNPELVRTYPLAQNQQGGNGIPPKPKGSGILPKDI